MGDQILETAKLVLKHALGVLLLCWRRMIRAALITFVVGFVLIEVGGAVSLGRFPAPLLTHVVAITFALVAAYAVGLTVLIDEMVMGALDIIKVLEGDARSGERVLAVAAEREAGVVGSGLMGWLGHSRSTAPEDVEVAEQLRQTQADIEATDVFQVTAPRPRVDARPVQADQLPRLAWAMEQLEHQPEWATVTPAVPVTPRYR